MRGVTSWKLGSAVNSCGGRGATIGESVGGSDACAGGADPRGEITGKGVPTGLVTFMLGGVARGMKGGATPTSVLP